MGTPLAKWKGIGGLSPGDMSFGEMIHLKQTVISIFGATSSGTQLSHVQEMQGKLRTEPYYEGKGRKLVCVIVGKPGSYRTVFVFLFYLYQAKIFACFSNAREQVDEDDGKKLTFSMSWTQTPETSGKLKAQTKAKGYHIST